MNCEKIDNRIKDIVLLGATGSIGTQTVKVCRKNHIKVLGISFKNNLEKAIEIYNTVHPILVHTNSLENYRELLSLGINVCYGDDGMERLINLSNTIVNAIIGIAGLKPTVYALENGKDVMLANKETMVVCGEMINRLAKENNAKVIPIDSEHNAIYRLIKNENNVLDSSKIKRIIITASGGAFREKTRDELQNVLVKDALNHPNWKMGAKITIDSSTMVNKGLEVIEAHYLFDVDYDNIETVIHPESIIHSMVEYRDNSVGAIMYNPSMIIPISNCLLGDYEQTTVKRLDFTKINNMSFKSMDFERFPMVKLAYEVGKLGGLFPAVFNASNEAAVKLFLDGKIPFLDIEKIINESVEDFKNNGNNITDYSVDDIISIDEKIKDKIYEVNNK